MNSIKKLFALFFLYHISALQASHDLRKGAQPADPWNRYKEHADFYKSGGALSE